MALGISDTLARRDEAIAFFGWNAEKAGQQASGS